MTSLEINSILDNSKELDRLKKEQEDVLGEINKIHKKLQTNPEIVEKSGDTVLTKLRSYYVLAKDLAEKELSVSNTLMAQLDNLLLQTAVPAGQRKKIDVTEPKKKRMKADSDVSKHSSAASLRSQHELAQKGEQVAARVTPDDAEKDEWFVVKVIFFDREAKEFEVFDEEPGDDEDGGGQRTYKLPMSRIIPFPKRTEPSSAPDYPTGKHVLAVYPGTTALYKATVVNPHRKRKSEDYVLEFDDDEEDGSMPQRIVPFHKVVPLPDGHRQ